MAELSTVLLDLIRPMVDDEDRLEVSETEGDRGIVILHVHAADNDIARLIGRKGAMATALRQVMSVAGHADNKRITIRFETKDK